MKDFLSNRILSISESPTLAMNQKVSDLREQGYDIINLSLGEPNFNTPFHVKEAAKKAIDYDKYSKYPPVSGYKDLREAIAKKFNNDNDIQCTANNILVSNGSKHSLSNIFECIINPGDEVIVYTPYWVSYQSILDKCGAVIVPIFGAPKNSFEPTSEMLEKTITPKTKAILFSNPSNPTGVVMNEQSLLAMGEVIARHPNLIAVADEIYEYINFYKKNFSLGSIKKIQNRVVTINGLSKAYAMTGWRIGYMTAHEDLIKACIKLQGQTTSGVCGIGQRAALAALSTDKSFLNKIMNQYKERCELILNKLSKSTLLEIIEPKGAFYLFCSIKKYIGAKYKDNLKIENANDFCIYLLEQALVSVVPGDGFGMPNYIRISYASSNDLMLEATERISIALNKLTLQ